MHRYVLIGVGGYALVNAAIIWAAPAQWYAAVPGVAETGPLNIHFARDVALALLSSALALIWSGIRGDVSAAVFGVSWLVFHALFHIWIWAHRGLPGDLVALVNLTGVQLPAWIAAWAALSLRRAEAAR